MLRAGRCVAAAEAVTFTAASLARAMFPGSAASPQPQMREPPPAAGAAVVTASHLTVGGPTGRTGIRDATFEVFAGQVVGIAGVEGAGQDCLLRALAGLSPPSAGLLTLPPNVSFIPADRHRDALVLEFSLYENLALRHSHDARGIMRYPAIRRRTRAVIRHFDVRTDSDLRPVRTLSGGNQQRFVLGRELESRPPLVVAEHPTRGLDLLPTATVHARLLGAAHDGAAVVVHSGDLDEVLDLADRVLVVHTGVVRELPLVRDLITRAMVGDW